MKTLTTKENWHYQLENGEKGEQEIANFLIKKGFKVLNYNKTIDYDLMVEKNNKTYTIEVKTDKYEYFNQVITNNMFIEISCNGKKSGAVASKAKYFFYYFPVYKRIYCINRQKLLGIIQSMGIRTNMAGDDGKVVGYLLDRDEVAKMFKVIDL